ncbi:MAG: hypothetical protein KF878_09520 [Planctomycetes bacterium]|nr:hypothetical protein [Planctomycetota bacterium]
MGASLYKELRTLSDGLDVGNYTAGSVSVFPIQPELGTTVRLLEDDAGFALMIPQHHDARADLDADSARIIAEDDRFRFKYSRRDDAP